MNNSSPTSRSSITDESTTNPTLMTDWENVDEITSSNKTIDALIGISKALRMAIFALEQSEIIRCKDCKWYGRCRI